MPATKDMGLRLRVKTGREVQDVKEDDANWYWSARKCLRFFPIAGGQKDQMMDALDKFVTNKLKILSGKLNSGDIGLMRRVASSRRAKTQDEVVVSFTSVSARDLVLSYARNLQEYVDDQRRPLAGIRLEIPERLLSDFKSLEQYGHAMKSKHKEKFKRHIKMDDTLMCLYMDVYIPKTDEWIRVDTEHARADNKERAEKKKKGKIGQKKLLRTCDSGEEDTNSNGVSNMDVNKE